MYTNKPTSLRKFLPLIIIGSLVVLSTIVIQWLCGFSIHGAMIDFMGIFFLVFGGFKAINTKAFARAYREYDIITQRFPLWGYLYPFIELALGIAFIMNWQVKAMSLITLILMAIGSIGVYKKLQKRETIQCACLGALFNIPMTYVTLGEDLLMAVMAGLMLF